MKVTTESDGPCRHVMHVAIPADAVQSAFDTVTQQFMREARIPGFRPGHAPRAMVERRYAKPISEQVRDQLLPDYYRKAIEQEQVTPVHVIDVDPQTPVAGQDMTFKVTVDLLPAFDTPPYQEFVLNDETAPVTDAEVDRAVQDVRRRFADYPEVDRPAAENDLILFDYDGSIEGESLEDIAGDCRELCSGRDVSMPLTADRELFPGFCAGLTGVGKDEERRVEVRFPADHPVKGAAGKTVVYQVRVKTVREEKMPELNPEFLEKINVKDEAELRKILRDQLEQAAMATERRRRQDAVVRFLMEKTRIDELPQSLVAEENSAAVQNMVREFTQQGMSREKIEENRDGILRWAEQTSQDRVKLNIILDRIATAENLTVSEDEFSQYLAGLAARSGMSQTEMLKTIKQRNAAGPLMDQLRRSKVMRHLIDSARARAGDADITDRVDAGEAPPKDETSS